MPRTMILVALFGAVALIAAAAFFGGGLVGGGLPPKTARLFASAPPDVRAIAAAIEEGEVPSVRSIEATGQVSTRYGDGITLLHFALTVPNVAATGPLIAAGADYDMPAKDEVGAANYVDLIAMPGGGLLGPEELDEAVRLFLEAGGEPTALGRSGEGQPLLARLATNRRYEAIRRVVAAGGDLFARETRSGTRPATPFTSLAAIHSQEAFATIDWLIDEGYLDDLPQATLQAAIDDLAVYSPRDDEITRENQRIGMRILKRNPHYEPPENGDVGSRRLFKRHVSDAPAEVPWEIIRSDAVE